MKTLTILKTMIRELLESLDIEAAPEGHRHGRSGWVQINCPDCDLGRNAFHLGIREADGRANCWACGPKYLPRVLSQITGSPARTFQNRLGSIVPSQAGKSSPRKSERVLRIPRAVGELKKAHLTYLRDRFGDRTSEIVEIWKLQGIGVARPSLAWRVFIPVFHRSRMVSWTARHIGNHELRYLSCSEEDELVPHKSVLFGGDFVSAKACIVHEGPFDAMATGPGAVCTFGTSFTKAQLQALTKMKRVTVCYDNSPEAQRQAASLLDYLEPFGIECSNVILDAKDSAEATPKELRRLRRHAFGRRID